MRIYQSPRITRVIKKLHKNEKAALDKAVREVAKDPSKGEAKKGDLEGFYVFKFRVKEKLWLLGYDWISDNEIRLVMVGPHENYYRDLKGKK